jgi:exo-1,4-beta-D-glucosaminidase
MTSSCENKNDSTTFYKRNLKKGWYIQSSEKTTVDGSEISTIDFNIDSWYKTDIPSTVMHTLVTDSVYKNIFVDDNMEKISDKPFKSAWWYRTEFNLENIPQALLLGFEGVNYKANVWLNGKQIADTSTLKNAFRQFEFDVKKYVKRGVNILAVEVFPPRAGDFSIGFVDWNPAPPDNNMGIFRNVYLEANAGIRISEPYIITSLDKTLSEAGLTASVKLTNESKSLKKGELTVSINGKKIVKEINLSAGETKKIILTPEDNNDLIITNPHLWWPYTLGEPFMYKADFTFISSGKVIDKKSIDFGIRTVSDYRTEEGHRGFIINGKKILIRGGGWVDRLLLDDTPESIKHQLEYVKDMNLNTIRLEGFWGKDQAIYDLCDKMGILVMVGWSCHWEWEDYLGTYCDEKYGGILEPEDIDMMSKAWQDQVVWLRNHPSIFTWLAGSDCVPKPELEKKYFAIFKEYDSTRVYLASAKEWDISLAGPTVVKIRGPYAYEPPVYWFADTLFGGAFGFNTETGPGAQVPPEESIKKMLSKEYQWPINKMWDYHCGRHEFNTLDRYTKALEERYGKAKSLSDYTKKAQVLNYELMRPMFEAFSAYRYKATGVIQWMLNSAWPEMYWQLYDYYLMPNGAYYGAKKASQPYHAIYDYSKHSIFVVNDKLEDIPGCSVNIKAYDIYSKLKYHNEIETELKANTSKQLVKLPQFTWNKSVAFIYIRITDSTGKEIDNNFYWISYKKDVLDYDKEVQPWNYHTPSKQYADFTALNNMKTTNVISSLNKKYDQNKTVFSVKLANKSNNIAFFINAQLVDNKTGNTILPVLWTDNYISLLPGETRILKATIENEVLNNKDVKLITDWYNK